MNTTNKIIECLDEKFSEYKQPVTILSRTDAGNDFIKHDAKMFDWDEISKLYDGDETSSVDGIYLSLKNDTLTMYLFEFKNLNLYDNFFDAKKQLE